MRRHDVNNAVSTSMRRHDVASTLIRRCFDAMCPLGRPLVSMDTPAGAFYFEAQTPTCCPILVLLKIASIEIASKCRLLYYKCTTQQQRGMCDSDLSGYPPYLTRVFQMHSGGS